MVKGELDEKLCKDFPNIFKDRHGDMRETAMCWGFDVDDGWYDLIYKLCTKLDRLTQLTGVKVVATQVKEKFGTLRFYASLDGSESTNRTDYDIIWDIISYTEGVSDRICEICGEYGRLRGTGWVKTLCNDHAKELEYTDLDGNEIP